jgi:hypothetical protein
VLAAGHKALVNHLRGIVATGFDMHALADRAVGACAELLSGFVPAGLDLGFGRGGDILGAVGVCYRAHLRRGFDGWVGWRALGAGGGERMLLLLLLLLLLRGVIVPRAGREG